MVFFSAKIKKRDCFIQKNKQSLFLITQPRLRSEAKCYLTKNITPVSRIRKAKLKIENIFT